MMKFGIIGYPLGHSFSPEYFKRKFEKEGLNNCHYEIFPLKNLNEFLDLLQRETEVYGLNVTTPFKVEVLKYLNSISESALKVNACNCIEIQRINDEILLIGHNTDILGFEKSLLRFLQNTKPKALVFGNGGASKAVQFVLKNLGIEFLVVSRQKSENSIMYEELIWEQVHQHHLLINTSVLGMYPDIETKPPIDYSAVSNKHYLFDLVYNPAETAFLKEGLLFGAKVCNGFEMLQLQADAAWEIWKKNLTF